MLFQQTDLRTWSEINPSTRETLAKASDWNRFTVALLTRKVLVRNRIGHLESESQTVRPCAVRRR